jgi:hypothetical protein
MLFSNCAYSTLDRDYGGSVGICKNLRREKDFLSFFVFSPFWYLKNFLVYELRSKNPNTRSIFVISQKLARSMLVSKG